jgi:transcriptional regulator with XRE-family HTH domain
MTLAQRAASRVRLKNIDRCVGARMRHRRIVLGMTQSQLADLIGVTYQQEHKYEKGINRITAGRLYRIAGALRVQVGYFYEGLHGKTDLLPPPKQQMLLELAQSFLDIPDQGVKKRSHH